MDGHPRHRWVLARSTDLLPGLLRLAVAEAAHRVAGTEESLERATREATAAALRALATPAPGPPGPPGGAPDLARCPGERALGILD